MSLSFFSTASHLVLPLLSVGGGAAVAAISAGAYYGRHVRPIPPDARLRAATEAGAYVDSYSVEVPILMSQQQPQPKQQQPQHQYPTAASSVVVRPLRLAQALFTCPAFQLERWILTAAGVGPPPPHDFVTSVTTQNQQQRQLHDTDNTYDHQDTDLKVGCQIGPWAVVHLLPAESSSSSLYQQDMQQRQQPQQEEQINHDKDPDSQSSSAVLLKFPGGHSYIKATPRTSTTMSSSATTAKSPATTTTNTAVEFILGSNLDAPVSTSWLGRALLPFHQWYSKILVQNAARHLQRIYEQQQQQQQQQ